ncbi:MAG: histidinol dehydrogenase [Candidatus Baltobacteraceae bacterium]
MTLRITEASDARALDGLYRRGWFVEPEVSAAVAQILAAVRERSDDAVIAYARQFDAPHFTDGQIRVPVAAAADLRRAIPAAVGDALDIAADRVRAFHARQLTADVEYTDPDGTAYALLNRPLGAIAAYVPGGTAVLPSSVIMTAVPAKVAGVGRVAVFTPPARDGTVPPAVRYACALCNVDELYAVGGAQAIAAAAYGTQRIAPFDKIVGPGNRWVTEAKRQIFGVCGIDGLAGPSEVLVVADESCDPALAASEMLAQAEHDPFARVAAVSESRDVLQACLMHLERREKTGRDDVVRGVLERSTYVIHARGRAEIFSVIQRFAPEHLALFVRAPREFLPHLQSVGAVFCGAATPVAWGDYLAGTNHVLPTSGAARFSSGLRTADFLRTFSVLENSAKRAKDDAAHVAALATFEGLPNHARTAEQRA